MAVYIHVYETNTSYWFVNVSTGGVGQIFFCETLFILITTQFATFYNLWYKTAITVIKIKINNNVYV